MHTTPSITSLIFLVILISASFADDDECPEKSGLAPAKLRRHLLCGYDKTLRPVKDHKDSVKLVVKMIVKFLRYEAHDSSFTVDSWLAMFWKDDHLKWNPEEYNSIKSIHLSDSDIWVPDLSVYNRHVQGGDPSAVESANCAVSNDGQVVCVPSTRQVSLCVGDLTRYPYDTQNCSVRFGSWVHSGEELNLTLATPAIGIDDLVPNGEWTLLSTNAFRNPGIYKCCPNDTYPSINFSFKLKRLAGAHAATIILPAISLIVLTLTSLWIDPTHENRINLCCVNIICGFLYVQFTAWSVPNVGDKTPLIVLFGRDSLLLSSFTLIFSVILKNLLSKSGPPPVWISVIVSVVIGCKPGQFLFLNDTSLKGIATAKGEEDGGTIIDNTENNASSVINQDYQIFAKILDRICFICYCIVYLCMMIAFSP